MSQDPFEAVREAPPNWYRHDETSTDASRKATREFVGEEFIQAYLNPPARDCPRHHPPECLCDVDVSKTAGIKWDKCPPELLNVETTEDLVRAAANIWLNYDLMPNLPIQKLEWAGDPEMVGNVKQAVADGATHRHVEETFHIKLDKRTFGMMRKALGYQPPQRIKYDVLRELHAQGLTILEIKERLKTLEGWSFHHTTISKAMYRIGLKPNGPWHPRRGNPNIGRPKGYKNDSGLSYREWREKHGESA